VLYLYSGQLTRRLYGMDSKIINEARYLLSVLQ